MLDSVIKQHLLEWGVCGKLLVPQIQGDAMETGRDTEPRIDTDFIRLDDEVIDRIMNAPDYYIVATKPIDNLRVLGHFGTGNFESAEEAIGNYFLETGWTPDLIADQIEYIKTQGLLELRSVDDMGIIFTYDDPNEVPVEELDIFDTPDPDHKVVVLVESRKSLR